MRPILLLLAYLIAWPTAAAADQWGTIAPPIFWREQPLRGPMHRYYMDYEELQGFCRQYAAPGSPEAGDFRFDACTLLWPDGWCEIYIRDDLFDEPVRRSNIEIHEEAHCRGWPSNHPR